jgi:hypothetical protein
MIRQAKAAKMGMEPRTCIIAGLVGVNSVPLMDVRSVYFDPDSALFAHLNTKNFLALYLNSNLKY